MGCVFSKTSNRSTLSNSDVDDIERVFRALDYLKTCRDFSTKNVKDALSILETTAALEDEEKVELIKNLLNRRFATLFVKIVKSLRASGTNESQSKDNFKSIVDVCLDFTDICIEDETNISLELMQNGAIGFLLEELQMSFSRNIYMQRSTVATMLMILDNVAACSANGLVRSTFRKANAVKILQNYLQSEEMLFKTVSLFILSRITSEEECDQLAATYGCISSLVELTSRAVESENNEVLFGMFGEDNIGYCLWRLIDAMNRLAINLSNKNELMQHGAVSVISEILQPMYMVDSGFPQVALEILWKLAFEESNREIITSHLTKTNKLE